VQPGGDGHSAIHQAPSEGEKGRPAAVAAPGPQRSRRQSELLGELGVVQIFTQQRTAGSLDLIERAGQARWLGRRIAAARLWFRL